MSTQYFPIPPNIFLVRILLSLVTKQYKLPIDKCDSFSIYQLKFMNLLLNLNYVHTFEQVTCEFT